jgi:hypothetical protein
MKGLSQSTIYVLTVCLIFLFSCKDNITSEAKYGSLDNDLLNGSFRNVVIKAMPSSTIAVCGKQAKILSQALQIWASAIGRTTLSFKYQLSCTPSPKFPGLYGTIATFAYDDPRTTCRSIAAARTEAGGADSTLFKFFACVSSLPTKTYLHEAGHIWGMCDQYVNQDIGTGMHKTCSNLYRSVKATTSVMNSGDNGLTSLSVDDIMGIRIMACRKDIEANQAWASALGPQVYQNWNLAAEISRLNNVAGRDLFLKECAQDNGASRR